MPYTTIAPNQLPPVTVDISQSGGWVIHEVAGSPEAVEAHVKRFLHDHGWARDGQLVNRADDGTTATLKRWHRS